MTSEHLHKFVKHKLSTDKDWALRALVRLHETNRFEAGDKEFLGGMANYYLQKNRLTDKQLVWVMKKMHKNSEAIIEISDLEKLKALAASWTP